MKNKINASEIKVLNVLWQSNRAMTANEISQQDPNLSLNTVRSAINKLHQKKLIEIDDVVYSGRVLSRAYKSKLDREEFILEQYNQIEVPNLVSHFLSKEKDLSTLNELETIIAQRKKALEEDESV